MIQGQKGLALVCRFGYFVVLFLGSITLTQAQPQEEDAWVRSGFKKSDEKYHYYVGVSDPKPTVREATLAAREDALAELIQREFSFDRDVVISTVEGAQGVYSESRSQVSVRDLNLNDFELVDQDLSIVPDRVPLHQCKVLYRVSKDVVTAQRSELEKRSRLKAPKLDADQSKKVSEIVAKEVEGRDARALARLRAVEDWKNAFPRLALDGGLSLGYYQGVPLLIGGKAALRFRLWPGFYFGASLSALEGSERLPDSNQRDLLPKDKNGLEIPLSKDTSVSNRIFTRVYLQQSAYEAVYIDLGAGKDRFYPTCPKNARGVCTAAAGKNESSNAYGGSLGFQFLGAERSMWRDCSVWLEIGGSYLPESSLKRTFSGTLGVGLPILRR